MPEDEAKYHMKRCVDSGLWVPEGGKAAADEPEADEAAGSSSDSKANNSTEDVD